MSLFSTTDLTTAIPVSDDDKKSDSLAFDSAVTFAQANVLNVLKERFEALKIGQSVCYMTDGAWSNYELLEYLLSITGPAFISFTTWAINEVAITRFLAWQSAGMITGLSAVIDTGLRNRKPEIYQQAMAAFSNLKMAHCHAKVTVLISATHHITFIGSANYTKNPRKEVGVLIWDENIARANDAWIKEVVNG